VHRLLTFDIKDFRRVWTGEPERLVAP